MNGKYKMAVSIALKCPNKDLGCVALTIEGHNDDYMLEKLQEVRESGLLSHRRICGISWSNYTKTYSVMVI